MRLRGGSERAGEQPKANKDVLDRNLELRLDLANVPSKRDLHEQRDRREHFTGREEATAAPSLQSALSLQYLGPKKP